MVITSRFSNMNAVGGRKEDTCLLCNSATVVLGGTTETADRASLRRERSPSPVVHPGTSGSALGPA